jgi:hypothetical protein
MIMIVGDYVIRMVDEGEIPTDKMSTKNERKRTNKYVYSSLNYFQVSLERESHHHNAQ